MVIGDKSKVAFIVGRRTSRDLRVVDIYVGNILVTYYDHTAYVPQFVHSIECDIDDLVGKKIDHSDRFMDWGPTTDDSYVKGVVEGANITLICRLVSGEFVIVEMPTQQLIETYQSVAKELRALHA